MTPELACVIARYNRWMNDKLYAFADVLTDEERKADRGALFRSIHGTFNHLLLADRVWLGRFTGAQLREYRQGYEGLQIIAHPECPPDVLAEADFVGSTAAMIDYVDANRPAKVAMVTECSMAGNVSVEFPDISFVQPCNLCPHMKRITLQNILHSLQTMTHEVKVDPDVAARARLAVERMMAV